MDDDLFTYEVKILELSYSLSVDQQMGDFDNGNLNVYERKWCYDACEKYLKYGDHTMVSNENKESVIATWLIWSYKKQFDEYMEINKQKELAAWKHWILCPRSTQSPFPIYQNDVKTAFPNVH
ncbi:hypothetical protein Tco_0577033 [Tanacetum coccineum]